MQKKTMLRFARFVVTIILLTYVLYKTGLFTVGGWRDLFDIFAHISVPFLLASIGVGLLLIFSSALKWYMLSSSRGLPGSLWRLNAYYMIGIFFNHLLPTSVGGDVMRMYELGRYTGRPADAAASVFVERFSGMATLVVLAFVVVMAKLRTFSSLPWLTIGLCLAVVGAIFVIWLILDERPFKMIQRLVRMRLPLLNPLFAKIEKFQQAVLAYKSRPGALWWALINSLIFYFLAVVNVWVSAHAFGSDLSFERAVIAVPVILMIMNLPISIGGIGLMEFAYSFTLGLFGVGSAVAISTALLIRAKSLVYAGVGGLLYALMREGRPLTQLDLSS